MQKITPFFWFDDQAEAAVNFYVSLFKNARILAVSHYGPGAPRPEGSVMTLNFELEGLEYMAINGGPDLRLTEAASLLVQCESQAEVDHLWDALLAGGKAIQCGWLTDRFGLTWQIIPSGMFRYIQGPDPKRAARAMAAMLQMVKIDLKALQEAYEA